jgi:hypothetical protein
MAGNARPADQTISSLTLKGVTDERRDTDEAERGSVADDQTCDPSTHHVANRHPDKDRRNGNEFQLRRPHADDVMCEKQDLHAHSPRSSQKPGFRLPKIDPETINEWAEVVRIVVSSGAFG